MPYAVIVQTQMLPLILQKQREMLKLKVIVPYNALFNTTTKEKPRHIEYSAF
jgi:hypothetical protein